MAFNNLGHFTIAPGHTLEILYWFGGSGGHQGGDDHGAQYCMAHPLNGYGATLLATQQGKANTGYGAGPWQYHVVVTSSGPYSMDFNLQGGGLT
jgi:hypothetical protein